MSPLLITISETIQQINSCLFSSSNSFQQLIIPSNIISVDPLSFNCCRCISSISIDPNNLYFTSIDNVLFSKNKATLIRYPFKCINQDDMVPLGVISIERSAFYHCINLITITIPATVVSIGDNAFLDCLHLMRIIVETNNPAFISDDAILFRKNCRALICFSSAKNLSSYEIPITCEYIDDNAFSSCRSLLFEDKFEVN